MLHLIASLRWQDILDILVVAYIIYRVILLLRGTGAAQIAIGIILISLLYLLATAFHLLALQWLLYAFLSSLLLILIIVFQRDIRRALLQVGKAPFHAGDHSAAEGLISDIIRATDFLSKRRIGALIAVEREAGLADAIDTGILLDARMSRSLLISIFLPASPLHDGCVIVRNGRIHAAACVLPLSQNQDIPKRYGTRHRAALGVSEESDAVVITVSEETQEISLVYQGFITPMANEQELAGRLHQLLISQEGGPVSSLSYLHTTATRLAIKLKSAWHKKFPIT